MHIKRFEGSTLAELLEKIRTELGEDALILETRTSKRGRVEVLAARPHAGGDAIAGGGLGNARDVADGAEDAFFAGGPTGEVRVGDGALGDARVGVDRFAAATRNGASLDRNGSSYGRSASSSVEDAGSNGRPEPAWQPVRAQGAAHAYARHGAAGSAAGIPSASKAGSGGAISRMARILSRKSRSQQTSDREAASREHTPVVPADPRAATSPVRDMDAWRAAADAALRASSVEVENGGPAADAHSGSFRHDAPSRAAEDRVFSLEAESHVPSRVDEDRAPFHAAVDEAQQARIEYLGRLVRSEHFSAIPLPLRELYLDLTDAEIDSNLVFQILSKMGQARMPGQFAAAPPDQLLAFLRKLVRTGGAVQAGDAPRAIALVGPTGVGKTTTVAKIAGHAAFHLRKRVALVSTDGYRIFGAQHLASYAALMGMKFENATDTEALRKVVAQLAEDCDLLLIDTSGRSPRDPEGIAETERLLAACPDLDIHLVLAANARVRDQALALERFSMLPIRHLIFTKLDETTRRGGLFTVALKAARPVSYLGTGQEVPDDLEEATIAGLTEVIAETLQKETSHA